nr:MAG TPA: CtsR-like protein [Caudoviricetes sp.]
MFDHICFICVPVQIVYYISNSRSSCLLRLIAKQLIHRQS